MYYINSNYSVCELEIQLKFDSESENICNKINEKNSIDINEVDEKDVNIREISTIIKNLNKMKFKDSIKLKIQNILKFNHISNFFIDIKII